MSSMWAQDNSRGGKNTTEVNGFKMEIRGNGLTNRSYLFNRISLG